MTTKHLNAARRKRKQQPLFGKEVEVFSKCRKSQNSYKKPNVRNKSKWHNINKSVVIRFYVFHVCIKYMCFVCLVYYTNLRSRHSNSVLFFLCSTYVLFFWAVLSFKAKNRAICSITSSLFQEKWGTRNRSTPTCTMDLKVDSCTH